MTVGLGRGPVEVLGRRFLNYNPSCSPEQSWDKVLVVRCGFHNNGNGQGKMLRRHKILKVDERRSMTYLR